MKLIELNYSENSNQTVTWIDADTHLTVLETLGLYKANRETMLGEIAFGLCL